MTDLYAYRRATMFRVHIYLSGGLGPQPTAEHATGEAAERDAVGRMRAHDATIDPRKVLASSFAHIEYVIPDGPQQGKVSTYARFGRPERHHITRYADPAAPDGGVLFECTCGAERASEDEVRLHQELAGNCVACWGEEDVHPAADDGTAFRNEWMPCPVCGGTGDYTADPPPHDVRFVPDHASYRPYGRPSGRS